MSIRLHCEHCGAAVTAGRELAGKRSKCPACGNAVYVPTPEDEIEELPLAPEDTSELAHERELQEERRRLDSLLARENRAPDEADNSSGRSRPAVNSNRPASNTSGFDASSVANGASAGGNRIEQALMKYLSAMRDSDFDAAERALMTLKLQPRTATEIIDRLAADQIPPAEMLNVPPAVYQGFLKSLRSNL